MKNVNNTYKVLNEDYSQEPHYVVELAFDFANTDLVYFTSHQDTPLPAGAVALKNTINENGLSGTTQKLDPLGGAASIGSMTIKLNDNPVGEITDSAPNYYKMMDIRPTFILARTDSINTTDHKTTDNIIAAGYSVDISKINTATVADCAAFDIVIVDTDNWSPDEHNIFIQDCYNAGYKVLVIGADSDSAMFYIDSSTTSLVADDIINDSTANQLHTSVRFGWHFNDTAHKELLTWAAGGITVTRFRSTNNIDSGYIKHATSGGIIYHTISGWIAPDFNSQLFYENIIYYLAGYAINPDYYSITALIYEKLANGDGIRHKRLRVYRGFKNTTWDQFELFQTQIVSKTSIKNDVYTINCADIQRTQKEKIFVTKTAVLTAGIGVNDILIPVSDYTAFIMLVHGTSYTDAPNSTVGYIKIDDEVIRYNGYTVDATLGPCFVVDTVNQRGRGALGTAPAEHTINAEADSDTYTIIEEFVYLELPFVKLAYAILTGSLYGSANTLPSHWHLNISLDYIATVEFTTIGTDWWNPDDDTVGRICRFTDISNIDGKQFLEKEIYQAIGAYSPVLADGSLGLRRVQRILYNSAYEELYNSDDIITYTELTHDATKVVNQIRVNWNWEFIEGEFTRSKVLIDAESIGIHGIAPIKTLSFKGLHGSRHTITTLNQHFDTLRDRYAGPPETLKVTLRSRATLAEVGAVVRIKIDSLKDYVTGAPFDRSMEIQHISINWLKGTTTLTLFGSTQEAGLVPPAANALQDTFYTSAGVNIETLPGVVNTAGVIHVASNLDLTTIGNLRVADPSAILYCDGPLEVDSGVTLTCYLSTQIRVKGHVQVNGTIVTNGNGLAGAVAQLICTGLWSNSSCFFQTFNYPIDPGVSLYGNVASQGGVITGDSNAVFRGATYYAAKQGIEYFTLDNPDGTNILGLEDLSLIGLPGCTGGHSAVNGGTSSDSYATGGDGGDSGGGILFVCRGLSIGASGQIDLSGSNGIQGGTTGFSAAGTGAGGYPGALVVLLDGNVLYPTGLGRIINNRGISMPQGKVITSAESRDHPGTLVSSAYEEQSMIWESAGESMIRVQYIPEPVVAIPDLNTYPDTATNISVVEFLNTPETPSENLETLQITITPPTDSIYSYSNVYFKLTTDTVWQFINPAAPVATITVAMDGATYDIKAVPVSIFEVESNDYIETTFTATVSDGGGVTLTGSNYLAIEKASYTDDITPGLWTGLLGGTALFNLGDSTNNMKWDGASLNITGTLTATTGEIGNWVIGTYDIHSTDLGVWLVSDPLHGLDPGLYILNGLSSFRANASEFSLTDTTIGATIFNFDFNGTALMAGWSLDGSSFTSPNGRIVLDATNNQFIAYGVNPANYVRMNADEIRGVDTVLGTTFLLPTDGSPPQFSSGVIINTEYQLHTASVIKTSDDPSLTGGVIMNDTGVHVYNSLGTRTAFLDAINSNHEFTGQITVDWSTDVLGADIPEANATATSSDNLLFNGDAEYGDVGFDTSVYNATGGYSGSAHWSVVNESAAKFNDNYIPVSKDKYYDFSVALKSDLASNTVLCGFACFDGDKQSIEIFECWRDINKNTTLHSAVAPTDTTVNIVPASEDWFSVLSPFSYIQWDIQADYTDLPQQGTRRITNIDKTPGTYWTLTLESAAGVTLSAGVAVGNSTSGSSYNYVVSTTISNAWVTHSDTIGGTYNDPTVIADALSFRYGTKYIKFMIYPNRTTTLDTCRYDNAVIKERFNTDWTQLTDNSGLLPADNADVTAVNTALDTSYVDGVLSSTVISNITQALADAATAQATADGKIETFFQTTAPIASGYGDIWFDTDDGYRIYTWNGTAWVDSQDTDIALAIADASTAQATADGKITTFYSATAPTAEAIGDLWFNTTTYELNRWSGTVWSPVSDSTEPVLELGVTINAGGITLGSGGALKAGQTDYDTGIGFFLGYSGTAHKFSIGNPATQSLTWDGANLTIAGDLVLDWATNVTGTNIPLANADVTLHAVEGGLTLSTGFLTGGTDTIRLCFIDKCITIGDETIYTDAAYTGGIQLRYNAGTPLAYIGDGGTKYIEFDGSDLLIGEDSTVIGSPAVKLKTPIFFETYFESIDGYHVPYSGGATISLDTFYGLSIACNGTASSYAETYLTRFTGLSIASWAKKRRLSFTIFNSFMTYVRTGTARIYTGAMAAATNARGFGFELDCSGATSGYYNLYAFSIDDVSETKVFCITIASNTTQFYIDYTPSTKIEFYADEVLVATITTNLPSSDIGGFQNRYVGFSTFNANPNSNPLILLCSNAKMWQEYY